jgi:hypothetical protein
MKKLILSVLLIVGMNFAYAEDWMRSSLSKTGDSVYVDLDSFSETPDTYSFRVKFKTKEKTIFLGRETIFKKACFERRGELFSFLDSQMATYPFKFGENKVAAIVAEDICRIMEFKK